MQKVGVLAVLLFSKATKWKFWVVIFIFLSGSCNLFSSKKVEEYQSIELVDGFKIQIPANSHVENRADKSSVITFKDTKGKIFIQRGYIDTTLIYHVIDNSNYTVLKVDTIGDFFTVLFTDTTDNIKIIAQRVNQTSSLFPDRNMGILITSENSSDEIHSNVLNNIFEINDSLATSTKNPK